MHLKFHQDAIEPTDADAETEPVHSEGLGLNSMFDHTHENQTKPF